MIRRRLAAACTALVVAATGLMAVPQNASAAAYPAAITSLTSESEGDGILVTWQTSGANTDYFLIKTGLTSFSVGGTGRYSTTIKVPGGGARSYRLHELDLARAGAAVGTGRQLYYRLFAVNEDGSSTASRAFPVLRAAMPPGLAAKSKGTLVRAATFNVRTAKATWDKRHWVKRRALVAAEIKASGSDIVAIQEMSPGRQDGKDGSTKKVGRQTTSLVKEMKKIDRGYFKLVRETQYKKPGTKHGTQGTRILYNTRKYELLSNCPEKTGKKNWNPACSITLPIIKGESEKNRRKAAYAAFEDRDTGKRFYMVSVHLDHRHSKSAAIERKYNALRDAQTKTILDRIDAINTRNRPVIFAGDINSYQNNFVGNAPHDRLIANGYYDTVAAVERINLDFPTINHYKTVLPRSSVGVATRIDVLMVQGSQGANRWWNMTKERDSARPSDHNLIAASIVL